MIFCVGSHARTSRMSDSSRVLTSTRLLLKVLRTVKAVRCVVSHRALPELAEATERVPSDLQAASVVFQLACDVDGIARRDVEHKRVRLGQVENFHCLSRIVVAHAHGNGPAKVLAR